MKNKIIVLTILALILGFQVSAKVWRVNSRIIPGKVVSADFTTLQAGIDGASANDTLYIAGSPTAYGDGTLDKPLVIIGAGYFLADNDTTQAYQNPSQVRKLTFSVGSEGSVVMGLYIYYSAYINETVVTVSIDTDSITLKKNRIFARNTVNNSNGKAYSIVLTDGVQDVNIIQNFISSSTTVGYSYELLIGAAAKCFISNNIFKNPDDPIAALDCAIVTSDINSNDITICNNVIYNCHLVTYYSTHVNNILINGTYNSGTGDYTTHNLCSGTQYPDLLNNQQNVDMSTVFVNYTATVDSGYVLKAAPNPAIDAGLNGGDCGVFSFDTGATYVLSGMPDIPAIFSFTLTIPIGVYLFPINIKAISHNEGK